MTRTPTMRPDRDSAVRRLGGAAAEAGSVPGVGSDPASVAGDVSASGRVPARRFAHSATVLPHQIETRGPPGSRRHGLSVRAGCRRLGPAYTPPASRPVQTRRHARTDPQASATAGFVHHDPADPPCADTGAVEGRARPRRRWSGGTAASRPPEVWGSWASVTSSGATSAADRRGTARRTGGCGRRRRSRRRRGRARARPSSAGSAAASKTNRVPDARAISRPWPRSPKPGHVGRGARSRARRAPPTPARLSVRICRSRPRGRPSLVLPWREPDDEEPGPEPLRQERAVARSCPALAQQPVGVRRADDREAVFRLRVADRVAAGERAAASRTLDEAPAKISARTSRGRSSGNAAIDSANSTRPPIAKTSRQRVRGGDLAERPRVVDERREEVERADDREVVADAVDGRVVGRGQARR